MPTVGTSDTAKMLAKHYLHKDRYLDGYKRAPNGFKRIGSGCYRVAILDRINDVVYKVGDYDSNFSEAKTAQKLRRKSSRSLGFTLKVAQTRSWYPGIIDSDRQPIIINAQEFARGAKNTWCRAQDTWLDNATCNCKAPVCHAKVLDAVSDWSELDDIHCENVLIDPDGVYWLIDMGC